MIIICWVSTLSPEAYSSLRRKQRRASTHSVWRKLGWDRRRTVQGHSSEWLQSRWFGHDTDNWWELYMYVFLYPLFVAAQFHPATFTYVNQKWDPRKGFIVTRPSYHFYSSMLQCVAEVNGKTHKSFYLPQRLGVWSYAFRWGDEILLLLVITSFLWSWSKPYFSLQSLPCYLITRDSKLVFLRTECISVEKAQANFCYITLLGCFQLPDQLTHKINGLSKSSNLSINKYSAFMRLLLLSSIHLRALYDRCLVQNWRWTSKSGKTLYSEFRNMAELATEGLTVMALDL